MDTTTFLWVLTCVTSRRLTVTSPNVSPMRTTSPTLKARVYVRIVPAMMFESAVEEENETSRPRKSEIPWNAGVCEPGIYGKAPTKATASSNARTSLYVGSAQSAGNEERRMLPTSISLKTMRTTLNTRKVVRAMTAR